MIKNDRKMDPRRPKGDPRGPKGDQKSTKKWKNRRLFRLRVLNDAFFSFLLIFSCFLNKKGIENQSNLWESFGRHPKILGLCKMRFVWPCAYETHFSNFQNHRKINKNREKSAQNRWKNGGREK